MHVEEPCISWAPRPREPYWKVPEATRNHVTKASVQRHPDWQTFEDGQDDTGSFDRFVTKFEDGQEAAEAPAPPQEAASTQVQPAVGPGEGKKTTHKQRARRARQDSRADGSRTVSGASSQSFPPSPSPSGASSESKYTPEDICRGGKRGPMEGGGGPAPPRSASEDDVDDDDMEAKDAEG